MKNAKCLSSTIDSITDEGLKDSSSKLIPPTDSLLLLAWGSGSWRSTRSQLPSTKTCGQSSRQRHSTWTSRTYCSKASNLLARAAAIKTRQRVAADVGMELFARRRSFAADLIGCSSNSGTETNRDTCTSNGMRAWPSSGLIQCDWPRAGGFGRAEIRRVQALVRDNVHRLRRAWDEYFTE